MKELESFQRKYLRGVAHRLKPIILIGQKGLTREVLLSTEQALERHELIKVKFNEFKEKKQKTQICEQLERETGSTMVGLIGHTAVFYRMQKDPQKRKIFLPRKNR